LLHKEIVREKVADAFMQHFGKRAKNNFSKTRAVLLNITNHIAYSFDSKQDRYASLNDRITRTFWEMCL